MRIFFDIRIIFVDVRTFCCKTKTTDKACWVACQRIFKTKLYLCLIVKQEVENRKMRL